VAEVGEASNGSGATAFGVARMAADEDYLQRRSGEFCANGENGGRQEGAAGDWPGAASGARRLGRRQARGAAELTGSGWH